MTHNGKPWTGPDQYEDATGNLMMLPVDMALLADPEFKKWVLVYGKDEDKFFKVRNKKGVYNVVCFCLGDIWTDTIFHIFF
jgi:catalase (peroxidase I)